MLLEREPVLPASAVDFSLSDPFPSPIASPASAPQESFQPAARYGQGSGPNYKGLALALGVQLLAVPLLYSLGTHAFSRHEKPHVVAMNLSPAAPEPKDEPEPQSEPQELQTHVTPQAPTVIAPVPVPAPRIVLAEATAPPPMVTVKDVPPAPPAPPPAASAPATRSAADLKGIRMISGRPPVYPLESRRKKEQGTVRLDLMLGTDGRVETVAIAKSSGFDRLDKAALAAVRRWRWAPVLQGGVPVQIAGFLEIPFVLNAS